MSSCLFSFGLLSFSRPWGAMITKKYCGRPCPHSGRPPQAPAPTPDPTRDRKALATTFLLRERSRSYRLRVNDGSLLIPLTCLFSFWLLLIHTSTNQLCPGVYVSSSAADPGHHRPATKLVLISATELRYLCIPHPS